MGDTTIFDLLRTKKVNYSHILLGFFIILGLLLRFYHVQYPVIGYHNWKSAHYLTEARNFAEEGFFKEGFFVPMRDTMDTIDQPPSGAHSDTFPLEPIIIGFLFRIFGESLALARTVGILFSIGSVMLIYLLVKQLFKRENLALFCAFLAAINPMFIFFSHNIQLVNSGLFFMLLGAYFYARWLDDIKRFRYMYLAALFIAISAMTKYTFIVIMIPVAISFPYKKIFKKPKKFTNLFVISILIASIFPAWFLYSEFVVKPRTVGQIISEDSSAYSFSSLIDLSIIGDRGFWATMRSYVADNFTLAGIFLFLYGSVVFVYFSNKKTKLMWFKKAFLLSAGIFGLISLFHIIGFLGLGISQLNLITLSSGFIFLIYFSILGVIASFKSDLKSRFFNGYLFAVILFLFVMGFKLSGHNYHQFPIAPVVLFMIAFLVEFISENISHFVKDKNMAFVIFLVVALAFTAILWGPSKAARERMYNTQFPGLDVAGNYINQHASAGDTVLHSSGQSFGFLWNANIPGYKGPGNLEYFMRAESVYNTSWVFVYHQWGMERYFQDPEIYNYIKNNYRLVQLGLMNQNGQAVPFYFLFRRGGTFNDSNINQLVSGKPLYSANYHYTHGDYQINYINIE